MSKKEILDEWCRNQHLIPHWYKLLRVSRQGKFFFAYYGDVFDEKIYQFSYTDFKEHYRDKSLEEILG